MKVKMFLVTLSLALICACSGSGASDSVNEPNLPDAAFMAGSVPPSYEIGETSQISYFNKANDYLTITAEKNLVSVLFDNTITDTVAELIITQSGGTVESKIPNSGLYQAKVGKGNESNFISTLRKNDNIMFAEPNIIVFSNEAVIEPTELTYYDLSERRHLDLIKAPEAWSVVESKHKQNVSNSKVTMGMMDICFDVNSSDRKFVNDIARLTYGGDKVNSSNPHGFLVSSLASAVGNNSSKPIGINWYSKIKGINVMRLYTMLYEITRMVYEEGLEVINISLGPVDSNNNGIEEDSESKMYYAFFFALKQYLVRLSSDKSFLIVVSAGNDNIQMNWPELKHARMIVVGTFTNLNAKASYSNYGTLVDLYAPASENGYPFFYDDNGTVKTVWKHGTSFSTPLVTGVMSLMWEMDKNLTPSKVKELLVSNSYSIGVDRVLNMYQAIDAVSKPSQVDSNSTDSNLSQDQTTSQGQTTSQEQTSSQTGNTQLTPTNTGLNTPINFTAVAQSTSSIALSWQSGGGNPDGYKLEKSTDGVSFVQIADLTSNIISYLDIALQSFTTYYYRVKAYRDIDSSSYTSAFATTLEQVPNPTLVSDLGLASYSYDVYVDGNYAYITDGVSGLKIINVSNPSNPQQVGSLDTTGYARKVVVSGNYAYVADGTAGLKIIDVTSKTNPTLAASYSTGGICRSVFVSGSYAYLAIGSKGIKIINISNPALPSLTGSLNIGDYARDLQIVGDYAYVAANGGLRIVDVSTPSSPSLKSSFDTIEVVYSLHVSGNYVYLANSYTGLRIIDASNISNLQSVGIYATSDEATGVHVNESYAYVGTYAGTLETVKISNPSNITLVKSVQLDDVVWGVARKSINNSDYVFLAAAGRGLKILSKY